MNYLELKYQVLRYYELNPDKAEEFKSELEYLRIAEHFPEVIFPNKSSRELLRINYKSATLDNGLKRITPEGLELDIYYPKEYTEEDAINAVGLLLCEQSMESAHKYVKVPQNTSVFDVGASEGFFGRVYCDETNEIYGFDTSMWTDAFLETLRGYDACFVPGLVSKDSEIDIQPGKPLGCIKIDVESMEIEVLNALEGYINKYHPLMQVAVYHYHEEAAEVVTWLKQHGYSIFAQAIPGKKMLYMNSIQYPPYFRYGVILTDK